MINAKTVVLFRAACILPGGMEKIMFEEAEYLEKRAIKTHLLTYEFDQKVLFGGAYKRDVETITGHSPRRGLFSKIIPRVSALRTRLNQLKPDRIVAYCSEDAM